MSQGPRGLLAQWGLLQGGKRQGWYRGRFRQQKLGQHGAGAEDAELQNRGSVQRVALRLVHQSVREGGVLGQDVGDETLVQSAVQTCG